MSTVSEASIFGGHRWHAWLLRLSHSVALRWEGPHRTFWYSRYRLKPPPSAKLKCTHIHCRAGLPTSVSFKLSIGGLGLAALGTIISWKLLATFGRRTLYLAPLAALTVILFAVGIISSAAPGNAEGLLHAQASLMLLWLLIYYLTVGPICYAIM